MRIAYSILPHRFADKRHAALENGLARVGFRIVRDHPKTVNQDDVLIGWGGSSFHGAARWGVANEFQHKGGNVIYCEEGYFREVNGEKHFAIAIGGHNGAGWWYYGGKERWDNKFNMEIMPWRQSGEHVIVRGQRGIGTPAMASPPDWHLRMAADLKKITQRPVIVREHHKIRNEKIGTGLDEALDNCHAVVTWASSIAPRSLLRGYPVFICAPASIAMACNAGNPFVNIESPRMPDRLSMFRRLAWAQWSMGEIEVGDPFDLMLTHIRYYNLEKVQNGH